MLNLEKSKQFNAFIVSSVKRRGCTSNRNSDGDYLTNNSDYFTSNRKFPYKIDGRNEFWFRRTHRGEIPLCRDTNSKISLKIVPQNDQTIYTGRKKMKRGGEWTGQCQFVKLLTTINFTIYFYHSLTQETRYHGYRIINFVCSCL